MTRPSHLRHVAAELRRIAGDSPRDVPASYRATAELLDAAADSVEEAEGRFEAVLDKMQGDLDELKELRQHCAVQDALLLARADELRAQCRPGAAEEVEARLSPPARRARAARPVAAGTMRDG